MKSSPNSADDRQPVVWLVNEGGHVYEAAERFGRIVPLTTANVNPFGLDRLIVNLGQRLELAKENDYILISGLAILNSLVLLIWLTKFEKAKVLQWSTKKRTYVPMVIHRSAIARYALSSIKPAE